MLATLGWQPPALTDRDPDVRSRAARSFRTKQLQELRHWSWSDGARGLPSDVFSEDELAQLRAFPEIGRVELIRHFTLTDADVAFVQKFRTGRNVLGAADGYGPLRPAAAAAGD